MIARIARSVALFTAIWPTGVGAAGGPLRTIDHVATTQTICANVVVHANAAIDARLKADDALVAAVARLRSNAFDDDLAQRGILAEIVRFASTIADFATRGSAETKRLTALADDGSPHGSPLRSLADALDRTFEHDRKNASLLASLPGTLQMRALRQTPGGIGSRPDMTQRGDFVLGSSRNNDSENIRLPALGRTTPPGAFARATASEIESGAKELSNDESRAAEVVEAAVTGC